MSHKVLSLRLTGLVVLYCLIFGTSLAAAAGTPSTVAATGTTTGLLQCVEDPQACVPPPVSQCVEDPQACVPPPVSQCVEDPQDCVPPPVSQCVEDPQDCVPPPVSQCVEDPQACVPPPVSQCVEDPQDCVPPAGSQPGSSGSGSLAPQPGPSPLVSGSTGKKAGAPRSVCPKKPTKKQRVYCLRQARQQDGKRAAKQASRR
jgi:hypothetical protein